MLRIGFEGMLYYNYNKEHPNPILILRPLYQLSRGLGEGNALFEGLSDWYSEAWTTAAPILVCWGFGFRVLGFRA